LDSSYRRRQRKGQEADESPLDASHFNNSKRYPLLFRFIVEETLDGHGEFLNERLLGTLDDLLQNQSSSSAATTINGPCVPSLLSAIDSPALP
jgi:hypothetical protein